METIHTTTRWRGEQPDEGQERKRRLLRVEELKLLRAAVGATMNSSLKFGAFLHDLTFSMTCRSCILGKSAQIR